MRTNCRIVSADKVGIIHIIGIGGIGMSGIAQILKHLGYFVQGSDLQDSYVTDRLRQMGISVFIGHKDDNVVDASIIVRSSAVGDDNPEVQAARKLKLPVISRSEMLAELMRFKHPIAISGTHGKTTTTSLIGTILEHAGLRPTIINGGIINQVGSNVQVGDGDLMVVEADESDGTFIKIPNYIAVATNLDPEHLDYYGDFAQVQKAYLQFINNTPFYGFAVLCFDNPELRKLAAIATDHKIFSYALHDVDADLRAINVRHSLEGMSFDMLISDDLARYVNLDIKQLSGFSIPMHGEHNVANALAATVVSLGNGVHPETIKEALATFNGVKRRFTKTGEVDGIVIIDDYAHHPIEIAATLKAASELAGMRGGKLIAVLQPHRYSRVAALIDEFAAAFSCAEHLLISDIYTAGEKEIPGISAQTIINRILHTTKQQAIYVKDPSELAQLINKLAKPSDLVIMLGAGDISKWAYALPQQLYAMRS